MKPMWYIRGSKELCEYFAKTEIGKEDNVDGSFDNFFYYINNEGKWNASESENYVKDVKEITLYDYLNYIKI